MKRHLVLLLLSLVSVSCTVTPMRHDTFTSAETLIAKRAQPDGGTATWRLYSDGSDAPTLELALERKFDVARLGVRASDLDQARADRLNVDPWKGVVIATVQRGTAGDRAGLKRDDVVLEIEGQPVASEAQFIATVENSLVPGKRATLLVRRGDGEGGHVDLVVEVEPDSREISDTSLERNRLESSYNVRQLTGMQLGELTPDLARAALEEDRAVVLVAGVALGSPAYLSGLRPGDRVLGVDGLGVESLDDLRGAVFARAQQRGFALDSTEGLVEPPTRAATGPLELRVKGPLGEHTASFDVVDDIGEYRDFNIPILFDCASTTSSRQWTLLDFIFQFGANYRHQYVEATTREPAARTFFSMLPFGFYEVESTPAKSRYRVLWLIRWTVRR